MSAVVALGWCLVSGAASALTFPPQGFWWLSWVALVPWLVALRQASPARAALLSIAFGCALAAPLGAWIPGALMEGFRAKATGAYGLWAIASLSYVPAIAVFGLAVSRLSGHTTLYPLAVGLGWGLVELSHRSLWPRVPWIQLGAPQIDTTLALGAAIWGVHGFGALLVTANASIAQAIHRGRVSGVAAGAAPVALLLAASAWLGHRALLDERSRTLEVALVQPGIPLAGRGDLGFQLRNLEVLFELTERAASDAQLVVWPENSLVSTLEGRPDLRTRIAALVAALDVPLLIGAHRRIGNERANSAALFQPGAEPLPVYDKRELLPFAEAGPPLVGRLLRGSLGRLMDRLTTGEQRGPVVMDVAIAGISICYEGIFSSPADPRAELVVNLVNDAWVDRTPAADHHLMLSRWRSLEAGAPLLRAARTGISIVQSGEASVVARAGVRERAVLTARVALSANETPFERWGYVPLVTGAGLVWGLALFGFPVRSLLRAKE